MHISLEEMKLLHTVQLEMFSELKRVLEELNIRYFFVHGSLLSAVTTHKFIEEDDDIDIAVFREDYERLLKLGNDIVDSKYFIQNSQNDDFPLSFAKFRNRETEFCQPVLKNFNCNKGIYIDIFPIDFVPETENLILKIKRILINARINSRLCVKYSWKYKCLLIISRLIYPSYMGAVEKREALYSCCKLSEYVTIFGGKSSERKMLAKWFRDGVLFDFCGFKVNCPENWDAYLERIYGKNYVNKNPAEDRISADRMVEVSASYIDFGGGKTIGHK